MDRKQRVLKADLTDVSSSVNDILAGTFDLDTATLYVGAELPFNHKYFELSTVNAAAKVLSSIHLWNGSTWVACVDINDGTAVAGVAFAQSGAITWARDILLSGWSSQSDSNDIAALAGTRIFNLYWAKFTWSTATGAGVCKYIGERFNTDEDLFSLYPDLRSTGLMTSFKTGKTDWKDQSFIAANEVVQHMRRNGIIIRREQILDTSLYNAAGIHKTAEIIYNGLGNGSFDKAAKAEKNFIQSMNIKFPEVDRDGSGDLSTTEKKISTSYLGR